MWQHYVIKTENSPQQTNSAPQSTSCDAIVDNMYSCFRCNRVYQHAKTLMRHLRHECGQAKQFICSYCGHRTQRSDRLLTHIRSQHPLLANELPRRKRHSQTNSSSDLLYTKANYF